MNIHHTITITALVGYATSSVFFLLGFDRDNSRSILTKTGQILFFLATLLMTYIAVTAKVQGIYSITSGFLLVSLLAWMTIGLQLFSGFKVAGVFVAPFITLTTLIHLFTVAPHEPNIVQERPETLILWHIYTSVIGEAFGILAVAVALLYIILQRAMKKKQLNRVLGSGLSVISLEKTLYLCIWLGFSFLTLGLILGAIYTQFYSQKEIEMVSKVIWALMVWLSFLIIIIGRNVFKIQTRKISYMSFIGFGIMALGFFGLLDL
ncbi:MAG: cytochrome c biogenesis protein CcsA [Pseudobacteriovorax sp.]|nr:cytochrome c biogenesis protein CcsA [Pseudobacteriovorax sp.]